MSAGLNEAAALARARDLDATLDGDVRHRIGEICGGLSEHGIVADLAQWLDDDEEAVLVECDLSRLREDRRPRGCGWPVSNWRWRKHDQGKG